MKKRCDLGRGGGDNPFHPGPLGIHSRPVLALASLTLLISHKPLKSFTRGRGNSIWDLSHIFGKFAALEQKQIFACARPQRTFLHF